MAIPMQISGEPMAQETIPYEPMRILCDHLVERSATLFLGAGVNDGIVSAAADALNVGRNRTSPAIKMSLLFMLLLPGE